MVSFPFRKIQYSFITVIYFIFINSLAQVIIGICAQNVIKWKILSTFTFMYADVPFIFTLYGKKYNILRQNLKKIYFFVYRNIFFFIFVELGLVIYFKTARHINPVSLRLLILENSAR